MKDAGDPMISGEIVSILSNICKFSLGRNGVSSSPTPTDCRCVQGVCRGAAVLFTAAAVFGTVGPLKFPGRNVDVDFGVAITSSAGPAYVPEMAYPAFGGLMNGVYNCFCSIGGLPGAFASAGTEPLDASKAWRIPLWVRWCSHASFCSACFFGPKVLDD
ncbi:nicotinate phosphoribosyltransferase [Venturia nashicola]|uniref:Nicotinate phosphoribosyltransferase n=1 Tax=Venturia nashicola TaxID=86259 RepID=A0A4Z1PAH6_9PEZI|nr:nicotinate phosphoribosyltransferase [Venturia nashicola]